MADYNSCTGGAVTLNAIDGRCDASMGGIKEIYIALRDSIADDEATGKKKITVGANDMVTAIEMALDSEGEDTLKFEKWMFRKQTGSFTSTASMDPAIGTNYITTEVALQFSKAEAGKRLNIQSAMNANSVVIVRDMYDQYILLGEENDVNVTAAVMQSGTASTDLSGFTLTLTDISQELPKFVDPAIIAGLLDPAKRASEDDSAE